MLAPTVAGHIQWMMQTPTLRHVLAGSSLSSGQYARPTTHIHLPLADGGLKKCHTAAEPVYGMGV